MMATVAANPVAKAETPMRRAKPAISFPCRPIDDRAPEAIGLVEDQSKDGSYKPVYTFRGDGQVIDLDAIVAELELG